MRRCAPSASATPSTGSSSSGTWAAKASRLPSADHEGGPPDTAFLESMSCCGCSPSGPVMSISCPYFWTRIARRGPSGAAAFAEAEATTSRASVSIPTAKRFIVLTLLRKQRQKRAELDLGLGELGGGVGAGDYADAGEEVGLAVAEEGAAEGNAEFAVFGGVHPADGSGVPAAVHPLQVGDRGGRGGPGLAADGGGRVQEPGHLDRRVRLGELSDHRRRQMLDVGDLDDLRLTRGLDPDR